MAPSRAQATTGKAPTLVKERHTTHDNEASDKDSTEDELERLVFGDSAGFRQGLRAFQEVGDLAQGKEIVLAEEDEEEIPAGLEGVADQDLFFLDDGPPAAPGPGALVQLAESSDDESVVGREDPAWSDSDDEIITVSLASRTQLRKLRKSEAEDVVSGKEYSKRLRKQFQILNPVPDWVHTASRPARKKRRTSNGSEVTDSEEEDEMDVDDGDEESLSARPLARLLQDVDSLTRTTSPAAGTKRKLRPEVIDIQRMKDIVKSGPSAITTLSIHPVLPLLLSSGGASSTITLHHLSPTTTPTPNPLLTTLHVKRTPISTALFHPSKQDSRIFLGSRRRYFHVWNLDTGHIEKITRVYGHQNEQRSMESFKLSPDGQYLALEGSARKGGGVLNILDATTLQWVAQARVEGHGGIADFVWWSDSRGLCIAGKGGEITEWLLEERAAIARWRDEGAVGTTTLALGGDSGRAKTPFGRDRWVAVGSSAGIVNIYDRRAWVSRPRPPHPSPSSSTDEKTPNAGIPRNPVPIKVLDQLVTPVSHLAFSPDGQVLCMASRWKADALRLVHLPSCVVYRNWPTAKTPMGRITALCFGEDEAGTMVLVVGNERGAVRGWEIRG